MISRPKEYARARGAEKKAHANRAERVFVAQKERQSLRTATTVLSEEGTRSV